MESFSVIYSDTAIEELREIRRYISRSLNNPEAARGWTEHIIFSADSLALFPMRYRVRGRDSKGNEMRFFPVGRYTIIYSVDEDKHTVNISRVVYGRRDIASML